MTRVYLVPYEKIEEYEKELEPVISEVVTLFGEKVAVIVADLANERDDLYEILRMYHPEEKAEKLLKIVSESAEAILEV